MNVYRLIIIMPDSGFGTLEITEQSDMHAIHAFRALANNERKAIAIYLFRQHGGTWQHMMRTTR